MNEEWWAHTGRRSPTATVGEEELQKQLMLG
jgi:hypothetical protein